MKTAYKVSIQCIPCNRLIEGESVMREKYKTYFVGCKQCQQGAEMPFAVSTYTSVGISAPSFRALVQQVD